MEGNSILLFLVFYPIIGALLSYLIGRFNKTARDYFADFIVVTEFIIFLVLFVRFGTTGSSELYINNICGRGLHFSLDGFRVLYGLIAAVMWMMTTIFSREYFIHYRNRNRYYLFNLLTLGATVGVFLSADLYTTFIFFEMMSFTSYVWVAHDEKPASMRAAETYLAIAVIGGLVMLMGIFLLYDAIGTLEMSQILVASEACTKKGVLYVAGVCMLFGFGAKAGAFPLHIWLPKAHPVAPAPASALLSGILTKSGVFGILVITCNIFLYDYKWGMLILIVGVLTMFVGAVLALFSVDLKRTLACSSVSQIGFILVGVGMQCLLGVETSLAARGSLLHMVNHSLIKLVLFMAAGVIFMNVHKLNLNEIRGFGHKKPLLNFAFLMGALGISGIPLWNGYISKTLIHESIVEYMNMTSSHIHFFKGVEGIFLLSGGFTVAYMAKVYIAIFIEKNKDASEQAAFDAMSRKYMNAESTFALIASAVLLPIMGFAPHIVMDKLADLGQGFLHLAGREERISYFSFSNLEGGIVSIIIGVIIYVVIVRIMMMKKDESGSRNYSDCWPKWWDLEDKIYRPLILIILPFIGGVFSRIFDCMLDSIIVMLRKTVYKDRKIPHELQEGTKITHGIGLLLDMIARWYCIIFHRKRTSSVTYVHKLAVKWEELTEDSMIISRSLSFGLFMFCAGLCFTLLYLLYW